MTVDGHPTVRATLQDQSNGLQVTADYTLYPENSAMVYGAKLVNRGGFNIEHLTNCSLMICASSPCRLLATR